MTLMDVAARINATRWMDDYLDATCHVAEDMRMLLSNHGLFTEEQLAESSERRLRVGNTRKTREEIACALTREFGLEFRGNTYVWPNWTGARR